MNWPGNSWVAVPFHYACDRHDPLNGLLGFLPKGNRFAGGSRAGLMSGLDPHSDQVTKNPFKHLILSDFFRDFIDGAHLGS
jgi:hypothetical protein